MYEPEAPVQDNTQTTDATAAVANTQPPSNEPGMEYGILGAAVDQLNQNVTGALAETDQTTTIGAQNETTVETTGGIANPLPTVGVVATPITNGIDYQMNFTEVPAVEPIPTPPIAPIDPNTASGTFEPPAPPQIDESEIIQDTAGIVTGKLIW